MLKASRAVFVSGTVGPDAMISSGSPSTSEIISVTSQPARQARERPPPLIRLSCLRTVFSSAILAPPALNRRVIACFSASDTPGSVNVQTTGQGQALFFRDGTELAGTWRKDAATSALQLLDARGNPVLLNPGQTWIEAAPAGSAVTWSTK